MAKPFTLGIILCFAFTPSCAFVDDILTNVSLVV